MRSDPEGIEESLTPSRAFACPLVPGGAPLRDDPRLLSSIPIGINAEKLLSEMDTLRKRCLLVDR